VRLVPPGVVMFPLKKFEKSWSLLKSDAPDGVDARNALPLWTGGCLA